MTATPDTYNHFIPRWPDGREPRGWDIYSIARRLLADGAVVENTVLQTWREEPAAGCCVMSMRGNVGELVKLAITEEDRRGLGVVKYRPPSADIWPRTAVSGAVATILPDAMPGAFAEACA
jgi:hypothetical protein